MPISNKTGASTKKTIYMAMPTKSDGSLDNRYSMPQFTKQNGTRDMRTTLTNKRK